MSTSITISTSQSKSTRSVYKAGSELASAGIPGVSLLIIFIMVAFSLRVPVILQLTVKNVGNPWLNYPVRITIIS